MRKWMNERKGWTKEIQKLNKNLMRILHFVGAISYLLIYLSFLNWKALIVFYGIIFLRTCIYLFERKIIQNLVFQLSYSVFFYLIELQS